MGISYGGDQWIHNFHEKAHFVKANVVAAVA
jgi:hypothetical protein